ncbi:DNA mismatch repair protein MutS [Pigmentibacter sp. JX0631]|uniref:DNA mismatch repair protein MutS n=1 Tax=Pigmentibacter sp. JX0631 TaxID=2976982 RepID=UPI0024687F33|nr:DNA mismatch repair protein MutS [Pigmentibacter sp. JX0631]WGL59304.1 DNA mismatch repair protein MutS [Pigmentibacter sp. JX0631]
MTEQNSNDFHKQHYLLSQWQAIGKEFPPHLKPALERLSSEHCSGIAIKQLDSPMMKQFKAAKDEFPDALLFFRMGDFYELFGIDAIIASDLCSLTLTSRDKSSDNPVPMAGVPVVGYKNALKKCVLAGFKVAVCDQVEDPRQAKGIVKREITRIATPAVPGDLDDDELNNETKFGCYLASILENKKKYTLAYIDVSTGEFKVTHNLDFLLLSEEIATISPKEILIPQNIKDVIQKIQKSLQLKNQISINFIEKWLINSNESCSELFTEFFQKNDFNRFGLNTVNNSLQAIAAILHYLKSTQKNILKNIQHISVYELNNHLIIDDATKKHLDFFYTSTGEKKGSLFHFLNKCTTASGSRLLLTRLKYPYKNEIEINESFTKVSDILETENLIHDLTEILRQTADIERLLAKIAQRNIDPKGLAWLRHTLQLLPELHALLVNKNSTKLLGNIFSNNNLIKLLEPLTRLLEKAFVSEPASILGKGGDIFNLGFSKELDIAINLTHNFNKMLEELEKKEKDSSQIQTLKIGYTGAFGYYFEISKGKTAQAPKHFIRKQTLTNCERYITPELKDLEEQALSAGDKRIILEKELFEDIRQKCLEYSQYLSETASIIAEIDLCLNFAKLANTYQWCKPTIISEPYIHLKKSTHPILAQNLSSAEPFIPNEIKLGSKLGNDNQTQPLLHLITGPNMAGKSTLMRQVALTQILSQMGSFVPAAEAEIGIADRIFTRIGSADHALKNQSTFMVEMLETANMLKFATPKSLLLLDEIGRGTSTYDGLSLAWSILEYLHDIVQARTLFSTHYHELYEVTKEKTNIQPMFMEVSEIIEKNKILFTRRYLQGSAGKSYGIHVAALAGLPQTVISRAEDVLNGLEQTNLKSFSHVEHSAIPTKSVENSEISTKETETGQSNSDISLNNTYVIEIIKKLDLNEITPKDSLFLLYQLKDIIEKNTEVKPEITGKDLLKNFLKQNQNGKKSKEVSRLPEQTLF